jgi:hypothetical protein
MAGILRTDTIQNSNTSTIITQTNSTTLTIGTSGQTVTLAAGATSSGFGATYNGAINWDTTAKTTTVTAASGVGYFINTTSGAVTVNLPVGVAGAIVALSDYAGTWQTNNVTVNANGTEKIGGVASAPATLNTKGQAINFVYVDSTRGWVNVGDATYIEGAAFVAATGGCIATCGDYKIHTFTGPGTFTVTNAGAPSGSNSVDYLVIAGGGGGGDGRGGGGGAGGYRFSNGTASGCYSAGPAPLGASALPVSVQGYPITVGSGGAGATNNDCVGSNGNPSIFSTITSAGGGRGGAVNPGAPIKQGGPGGSGGGAGGTFCASTSQPGGTGNSPPVSPSQGNNGGNGVNNGPPTVDGAQSHGAGGGGAGAAANPATGTPSTSTGGNGLASSITGTSVTRGGGGGAASDSGSTAGGSGGGGTGVAGGSPSPSAKNGTTNTGGGGGGVGVTIDGGSGGSGIVVIRYKYQ